MDMILPMIYFDKNHFYPFVLDWQENSNGRHVIPGIGIYRLIPQYGGWPQLEIERQLNTSRSAGTAGTAMFRAEQLLGLGHAAYTKVYSSPALVPPMSWAGPAPRHPQGLKAVRDAEGISLAWDRVEAEKGFPAIKYNVYVALDTVVDIDRISSLAASSMDSVSYRWNCITDAPVTVAVTAVNAYGIESAPAIASFRVEDVHVNGISLPELPGWGYRLEVCDLFGRKIYSGRYSTNVGVEGLQGGNYMLKVYDRHGAVVLSRTFKR